MSATRRIGLSVTASLLAVGLSTAPAHACGWFDPWPAPVEQAPIEEAPVDETPAEEAPADETPAEEAPVDEPPAE